MAGDFGKQIGRLHIRVLPNADKFRQDLKKDLVAIQKSVELEVPVTADTTKASEDVKRFVARASKSVVKVRVAAQTAVARAQLVALARDRKVNLNVSVQQKGLAAATTALARLSGLRVATDLLKDFSRGLQDLDKKAGAIARVSLLVANLTSVLAGAAVGLITVAGDVAKMGNTLLVLPAAIAGVAIGMTTLIIALKSAKTELASLGPAFTDLQAIIQRNFWAEARQPILDLVNSVLPALRTGFASTAEGIGRQLGALSAAFQRTLGGGVLEGMFTKLRETIDIVTTGMTPLAEAITTLGVVGGQYLPRLATFLVDVGTKFNDWLQVSAGDGSLQRYIEEGITAVKDFARAISGVVGIFRAIDSAATAAGAGGLKSLADNLQGAAAILQSPAVQAGLTTIIEGVRGGLAGLGGGINSLGSVLLALAPTISTVLTTAGQALGAFITALSTAFAQPEFAQGLLDLFDGIYSAVMSLAPAFPALGQLFGQLATTVGMFLSALAPVLAQIKIAGAPVFDALLLAVQPLIPIFGGLLLDAITALTPVLEQLATFITENQDAFTTLAAGIGLAVIAIQGGSAAFTGLKVASAGLKATMSGIETARIVAMYGGDLVRALGASTAAMVKNVAQTAALKAMYAGDAIRSFASAFAAQVASIGRATAAKAKDLAQTAALKAMYAGDAIRSFATAVAAQAVSLGKATAAKVRDTAALVAHKAAVIAASVASKAAAAAQWLLNAAMSANPIGLIIAGIAALVAGLVWFFTQTKLGQEVWANITAFISSAIETIRGVIDSVVTWIRDNWQSLLLGMLGPVGMLIAYVVTNFDQIKAVVMQVVANVVAVWNAFWEGLVAVVSTVWAAIVTYVQTYIAVLTAVIQAVIAFVVAAWTNFWTGLSLVVQVVWAAIVLVVQTYINMVSTVISTVVAFITAAWSNFWTGVSLVASTVWAAIVAFVQAYITTVQTIITTVVAAISAVWSAFWTGVSAVASAILNAIVSFVSSAINNVRNVIVSVTSAIRTTWQTVWNAIKQIVSTVFNAALSIVSSVLNGIRSTVSNVMNGVRSVWSSIWSSISSTVSSVVSGVRGFVQGMVSSVQSAISNVLSTVRSIQSSVMGVFAGAGSWLAESGRKIVQGLVDGIKGMAGRVKDAVGNVMQAARNLLPFSPAKEGPFSGKGWTLYSGRSISTALAQGITDNTSKVRSAALEMVDAVPRSVGTSFAVDSNIGSRGGQQGAAHEGDTYNFENVGSDPAAVIREVQMAKKQQLVKNRIDGGVPIS